MTYHMHAALFETAHKNFAIECDKIAFQTCAQTPRVGPKLKENVLC